MPPSDMSLSDAQDATQNVYVLSKGADFPETWSKKTLEPPNPSLTSKVPARSALRSILIAAACTSSLMITTGLGSALTISLPYAGDDLHIPKNDLQWILSAFSISSACFLLPCGRLADLYGRKLVWLIGYLTTGGFGLAACFVRSWIVLDVLRGLQGLGAAAMIPASLGILSKTFLPGPSRSIAFATFAAGAPIGAAFSNVLGGVLMQLTSATWRGPLYLWSGFTFAFLVLGYFVIDGDEPSTEEDRRVDWIGAILITSGLLLIVFVLSDTSIARDSRGLLSLFATGVILVLLFTAWQYYLERRLDKTDLPRTFWTAPPLMKPSMWTQAKGRFAVMQIIACINWAAFSCWLIWVQLYYQTYLNLTPIRTMLRVLPMFIMGLVALALVPLIIGRINIIYIVAIGTILTGCANIFFAVVDPRQSYWAVGFPSACLIVLGVDFTYSSGTLFVSKVSRPSDQSVAGGLFQAMTQIGSTIGLSVSTAVYNKVLRTQSSRLGVTADLQGGDSGDSASRAAQLKAYQAAMWTGFALGMFCTILCMFLSGVGVVGEVSAAKNMVTGSQHDDSRDAGASQDKLSDACSSYSFDVSLSIKDYR